MREPIPIDPMSQPRRSAAAPAIPDEKFMDALTVAIRGGATPGVAARWLGVSRATWRNWRKREGEPYDTLRERVRVAVAHLEVRLMNDLARKNPSAALARLRTQSTMESPDYARHVARMAEKKPWEKLGLTLADELFCRELITDPEENALAAVKRVGMWDAETRGSLKNLASNLRKKPKIIARIAQLKSEALMQIGRKTRTKVTAERVLQKYASIAFADMRRVVTVDEHGVSTHPSETWYDEDAEAIKSVSNTSEGVKVEFHPAQPALDKLAEITGLTRAMPGMIGGVQIERALVLIPDNHRHALPGGSPTNGSAAHRPSTDIAAIVDLPPRDDTPNGDRHDDPDTDTDT